MTDEHPEPFAIYLRDRSHQMAAAWKSHFSGCRDVVIAACDIFQDAPTGAAIVSPANSFGFMDGGIDLAYSQRFGWGLQRTLQRAIEMRHDGELLVGDAEIVPTGDSHHPFLISAPTMRVPMQIVTTVNAYLAFRAALRAVTRHNVEHPHGSPSHIRAIMCPGLGTATGRLPHGVCASQMFSAYSACKGRRPAFRTVGECMEGHEALIAGHRP